MPELATPLLCRRDQQGKNEERASLAKREVMSLTRGEKVKCNERGGAIIMMGLKERAFAPLIAVSLEDLVPQDHFYRRLERTLDLSFVRTLAQETYAHAYHYPQVFGAACREDRQSRDHSCLFNITWLVTMARQSIP